MKTKLLALTVLFGLSLLAVAQEPKKETKPAATPTQTSPAKPDLKPAKPGEGVTAIVGGDVYTVTREIIRGGTVLLKNGKITAVGMDVAVPEGAKVIDAKGKVVTPGFVAMSVTN